MLIDWFTVGAQVLNFLLLVWLLKHFLYQPILNAIDARERETAKIINDAEKIKREASDQLHIYQQNNQLLEQQRQALITQATDEANQIRDRLLNKANQDAQQLTQQHLASISDEFIAIQQDIATKNLLEVFAISNKVLTELASQSLQESMFALFIQHLTAACSNMTTNPLVGLDEHNKILVRSRFALSQQQQQQIEQCLQQSLKSDTTLTSQVEYQHSEALLCGIEISTSGWKLAWSSANYLQQLQQRASELAKQLLPNTTQPASESPVNVDDNGANGASL
ncbi:F0F1 ATP synthase subunit B [Neptunicella marina]|uniref:ATP synthase subunit b n=1 Tax=Neptunicella marina TaxID=2125989 RepID=A0A8J6IRI0_9ALTE|nr:F0F1 ATP synthase subunit B [Neptunicella marina]MBC3764460.1 F0F1 ATP synthase subunit B [Neptunicella marina]